MSDIQEPIAQSEKELQEVGSFWELDEMQRASKRHQREAVPYPSQMNSSRDNFEDYYLHPHSPPAPTERSSYA